MSKKMEWIRCCPCCGDARQPTAGREAPGFDVAIGSVTFRQPSYRVVDCPGCGLLYKTARLSDAELDAYYGAVDHDRWDYPDLYPTERAVMRQLQQLPLQARILDFGCSTGRLLGRLATHSRRFGIELGQPAAIVAKERGLTMLDPLRWAQSPERFDAIVTVDVFEHLGRPFEVIEQLARLLVPGGRLIIVTGNGDAPECRVSPAEFWYFRNVEHLCMITRRTTEVMAERLGLELAGWEEMSHYEPSFVDAFLQIVRKFAYWQFRNKTWLSRLLSFVPWVRRARHWEVSPPYTRSADHVVIHCVARQRGIEEPQRAFGASAG